MQRTRLASWMAALVLATAPVAAHAHAVVTKTTLDHTQVRAGTPTDVTLRFNAAIEARFTHVVLLDAAGKETAVELGPEAAAGEVVVRLPGLTAGRYGLKYRVLAADGHVTESIVRFRVEP